eukprot:jgi/Mesen1/7484/ME000039S06712
MEFENVITAGTDRNASHREKVLGKRAAERLQEKIAPFFLRRMKSEIFNSGPAPGAAEASASGSQKVPVGQAPPSLPSKEDIIVWLKLTERQSKLYLAFLQSDSVRALLNESRSPLAAITVRLRHPPLPPLLSPPLPAHTSVWLCECCLCTCMHETSPTPSLTSSHMFLCIRKLPPPPFVLPDPLSTGVHACQNAAASCQSNPSPHHHQIPPHAVPNIQLAALRTAALMTSRDSLPA